MSSESVPQLAAAMAAWDEATAAWQAACERGKTEADVRAYKTARAAWFDAQSVAPAELAHDTFIAALREHHGRSR